MPPKTRDGTLTGENKLPNHRLLACFAHPDDEAFPVGAALAAHTSRGVTVRLVTATLGEEGEIRQEGSATRETIGSVRRSELAGSAETLGIASHDVLHYRDSGMAGTPPNQHPRAYINSDPGPVVERLIHEIRSFRPQVVLTFGPDGLYGHPDHIAISRHTTQAFHQAANPEICPHHLSGDLSPHQPDRLLYSVRPRGFRTSMALRLREAGIDFPLPPPERVNDGVPTEEIHLEFHAGGHLDTKLACIKCHFTQLAPDWPYETVPREVTAQNMGREYYVRAWPPLRPGEGVSPDFFAGLSPDGG